MNPRKQQITAQRKDILEALDEYIYLTTKQLYAVLPKQGKATQGTWERGIRRATDLFEQAGFITHGPMYQERKNKRSGFATRLFVRFLTRQGAEKLAELRTQVGPGGIHVPPVPHYQRKPASLAHEAEISELHIALKKALKPPLKLHWLQKEIRKGTNPDAIFGIEDTSKPRDKSTYWFFVEIEKSRQGHWENGQSQLVTKLQSYDRYRMKGEVTKDWSYIRDFRVIVQVETSERMVNLLRKLSPILPHRSIWITSKELIEEKGILGSVFYTPKDFKDTSHSLTDLVR
jgi:hypothetical protein